MGPGTSNPAFLGQYTSTYGDVVEERKQCRAVKRFSDSLRERVEATYCLGGASEDETWLAYADFCQSLAHMFLSQISTDVDIPPTR